jgi:predicted ATPase
VSFRVARVDDYWRRLEKRSFPAVVVDFTFSGFGFFCDGSLSISPGLTAIVGGNGVGKSTLGQAFMSTLEEPKFNGFMNRSGRFTGSTLAVNFSRGDRCWTVTRRDCEGEIDVDGDCDSIEFSWIDPSQMAMLCQRAIYDDKNFADVIEPIGPRELNDIERQAASYVVGKDYDKCEVWEVRDWGAFDVWPYFKVCCDGVEYGSEDMGRGELSILCALWVIYLAHKDSFLLFEEPETHVSVRSQKALMDVLAWAISVKGVNALVITHSPSILNRVPLSRIRLVTKDSAQSVVLNRPTEDNVRSVISLAPATKLYVLVEDHCGLLFTRSLINLFYAPLSARCVFVNMQGSSEITTLLKSLPSSVGLEFVGVYDGDQRSMAIEHSWPVCFLPGDKSPEFFLRSNSRAIEVAVLSGYLKVDEDHLRVAFEVSRGLDDHDWILSFSSSLDLDLGFLVKSLLICFLDVGVLSKSDFLFGQSQ